DNLETVPSKRRVGLGARDNLESFRTAGKLNVRHGLGVADEFALVQKYARNTLKVTITGPWTMARRLIPDVAYSSPIEVARALAAAVHEEIVELAKLSPAIIQIDEPSFSNHHATEELVDLFNQIVAGVPAKFALHICFGNYLSRTARPRTYTICFPGI